MEQYTNAEIVTIANKQKAIIWLILASLAVFVFPPAWIVIAIVQVIFVYQLAEALKLDAAWAWCVGMIIPLVSLILLLVLNGKATTAIRGKGITVGLMGADKAQLDKLAVAEAQATTPVPPTIATASPQQDFDQQLRKLAKLKEDGVITDEDFTRKKREILGTSE